MFLEKFFPFTAAPKKVPSTDVELYNPKTSSKAYKVRALGLGFNNGLASYYLQDKRRALFEESPYNFDKIIQAIDTDSYLKQGLSKYQELFWKEGWEIVSENPEAVDYLWERIDLMELVMGRPFQEFLIDVADQLVKFHNVFIGISRGDITPYFSNKLTPPEGKQTISGYYIIPTEKVRILRDKYNNVKAYRQDVDETSVKGQEEEPIWTADQVIHLHRDRKPGRAFGTPFLITALDDVISLRQIEEDVLNLTHKELFPIYKYKIGTPEAPATPEEMEQAFIELENMRTEGGLIIPDRHDVEVVGAEGRALDVENYLNHFKERVAAGIGLYPHHLGMSLGQGTQSATDRLDIALYDKIKHYQRLIENAVRLYIFNPILIEGGYDPFVNPVSEDTKSDRCLFRFRQIDTDTQVKIETHILNLFAQNLITWEEARLAIAKDPEADPDNLFMSMQHKLSMEQAEETIKLTAAVTPQQKSETVSTTSTGGKSVKKTEPVKPDAAKPSTGGKANQPNNKRGLGNLMKPSNQFGRRMSPNIRHDDKDNMFDEKMYTEIVELLKDNDEGDDNVEFYS